MTRQLLKRGLQPTDFADSDCRVSEWREFLHYGIKAYRVWVCRSGMFWFQRHEWQREGRNQTELDPWIPTPIKRFHEAMMPAPEDYEE